MAATQSETPASVEPKDRSPSTAKPDRSRMGLLVVSLLFVAMATISTASTYVALQMAKERAQAQDDFQQTSKALEQVMLAVCTNSELKGSKMEPVRQALLKPAVDYYEQFLTTHAGDKKALSQVASAHFHLAGLRAKLALKESSDSLAEGLFVLRQLLASGADADAYPEMQTPILKVAAPSEWLNPKNGGGNFQLRGLGVITSLTGVIDVLGEASVQHPQSVGIRDDLAAFLKASCNLLSMGGRNALSLEQWLRARDILEQLSREQPANNDYKARLAEALMAAGRLQKTAKENDAAAASFQRAVEIREQLAAANPDDKSAQQDLIVAKRELEKLKPAPPAEKPADSAAAPVEKDAAPPAETPAKAEN